MFGPFYRQRLLNPLRPSFYAGTTYKPRLFFQINPLIHVILRRDPKVERKAGSEHCAVSMDTVVLEVGTVEFLPLQGRVGVVFLDMGTPGVVVLGLLGEEHNPLEGVDRDCVLVDKVSVG